MPIVFAICSLVALSFISFTLQTFSLIQNRREMDRLNRLEEYPVSEMMAWHDYYQKLVGITPSSRDEKGRSIASYEVRYDSELPSDLYADPYDPTSYDSSPLNIVTTMQFDFARATIRRSDGSNLRHRRIASAGRETYCGQLLLRKEKWNTRTCLVSSGGFTPVPPEIPGGGCTPRSVTLDFLGGPDRLKNLTLQNDGKILVAGSIGVGFSAQSRFGIARFNTDLTLDESFGNAGKVITDIGSDFQSQSIEWIRFQPDDQKIIVAGSAGSNVPSAWVLARYLKDGGLDATFGNGGIVVTRQFPKGPAGGVFAFDFARNGAEYRYSMGGYAGLPGCCIPPALARYRTNGSLDPTFGEGGQVQYFRPLWGGDLDGGVQSLILLNNGKILQGVWGGPPENGSSSWFIHNENGEPGTDFEGRPSVFVDDMIPDLMVAYNTNRVLVKATPTAGKFPVKALSLDGTLDTAFGNGGFLEALPAEICIPSPTAVLIDAKNRILESGWIYQKVFCDRGIGAGANDLFVARHLADGTVDLDFGERGIKRLSAQKGFIAASQMGTYSDGSSAIGGGSTDFQVVCVSEDGKLP